MVAQAYSLIIQSLARYHSPISWEFYTVWQADDKKNSEQKRYLFKIAELFHIIFLNWLVFHYYLAPSEVYLLDWNTQPENYPMMKLPKSQVLHRPHLNSKIVCQENNSLSEVIWTLFDLIIQKRKAMGRVCLSKGILTLVTMRAAPSPFIASPRSAWVITSIPVVVCHQFRHPSDERGAQTSVSSISSPCRSWSVKLNVSMSMKLVLVFRLI